MWSSLMTALAIFVLRVIGNTFTTLRLVMIARSMMVGAFILAFLESLIFAIALGTVVQNLGSALDLFAYSLGFAVGGPIAMALEKRLLIYYVELTVISGDKGHEVAEAIRALGFGATETDAHGGRGDVTVVKSVMERKQLPKCLDAVHQIDPKAFITTEGLRYREHGIISLRPGLYSRFND